MKLFDKLVITGISLWIGVGVFVFLYALVMVIGGFVIRFSSTIIIVVLVYVLLKHFKDKADATAKNKGQDCAPQKDQDELLHLSNAINSERVRREKQIVLKSKSDEDIDSIIQQDNGKYKIVFNGHLFKYLIKNLSGQEPQKVQSAYKLHGFGFEKDFKSVHPQLFAEGYLETDNQIFYSIFKNNSFDEKLHDSMAQNYYSEITKEDGEETEEEIEYRNKFLNEESEGFLREMGELNPGDDWYPYSQKQDDKNLVEYVEDEAEIEAKKQTRTRYETRHGYEIFIIPTFRVRYAAKPLVEPQKVEDSEIPF